MNYVIIGGGPTGLSLAYALSNSNYNITLIEKNDQLGGSWNSQWVGKYWSENNPRVLLYGGYLKNFLNEIGINEKDLEYVYGNFLQLNYKMMKFILSNINKWDIPTILKILIKYNMIISNETLQEVLNNNNLDQKTKRTISIISILISDRPEKTNINDFFMTQFTTLYQYKDSNLWHRNVEKILKSKGVTIYKNTLVTNIVSSNNKITGVNINNKLLEADRVFLCCQSSGILNILNNSNDIIKNNWYQWNVMKEWCKNTYYIGFGFQMHFFETVNTPNQWCWSCTSDWTVIILPVSNWLTTYTNGNEVKTVWSCCIVDMDTKSKYLNKTANECLTKDVVVDECVRQIKTKLDVGNNFITTTSKNLVRINDKWESENTGFSKGSYDDLPMRGKLDNLFALGCFTEKNKPSIAHKGTAILSTVNYLNTYEPEIESFHNRWSVFNIMIFIIIIILIIIVSSNIRNNFTYNNR